MRRKLRGSALILTLFFLMFLHLLAIAFITMIPTEMNSATRHRQDVTAYYVADSGLQDTLAWLEFRAAQGTLDADIQNLPGGAQVDNDEAPTMRTYYRRTSAASASAAALPTNWSWEARIHPDPFTGGNPNIVTANPIRAYKLRVLASYNGTLRRELITWINQASFAGNCYMYDRLAGNSTLWLNMGTFRIDGDFHTNGALRLSVPNWTQNDWNNVGANNANAPFQGQVTFAQVNNAPAPLNRVVDGVVYNGPNNQMPNQANLPYDRNTGATLQLTGANSAKTRYDRLSSLGVSGFRSDAPVQLPTVSTTLAQSAWGGTPPANPASGVNIQNTGNSGTLSLGAINIPISTHNNGYYLSGGDILEMELSVDGGLDNNPSTDVDNNSVMRFKQNVSGTNRWRRITNTYSATTIVPGGNYTVNGVNVPANVPLVVPAGHTVVQNREDQRNYQVYQGTGNGLFYVNNANILELDAEGTSSNGQRPAGLVGANKGRRTIAVDQSNQREIRLTGSLNRADTVPGQDVAQGATRDQLGLVAYAVRFATQRTNNGGQTQNINRSQYTQQNPLYLYAAIFAGRSNDPNNTQTTAGGFGTIAFSDSGFGAGHFDLRGSLTEGIRQAKGTFNAATGQTTSGFGYSYHHDGNFDTVAPPFFPAQDNFTQRVITEITHGG